MFGEGGIYEGKADRVRRVGAAINPVAHGQSTDKTVKRRLVHIDVSSEQVPLPAIARTTLLALGCSDAGRFEKVAWRVPFDFEGIPCALEDQKLGVNLYLWVPDEWDDPAATSLGDRVMATLQRAIRVAETDIFYPAIKSEVKRGRLILKNNVADLQRAYLYFRMLAEEKGSSTPQNASAGDDEFMSRWIDGVNRELRRVQERRYLSDSMIVAFFAYLERYLALALPFSDADLASLDLTRFLAAPWGEKFKTVLDLVHAREPKLLYDRLLRIAETFRNPRAHGHDKMGSTSAVYLEGVGAVPLMLTGIEETPAFKLDPFDEQGLDDIKSVFDDVEALMMGPALGNAARWITGGFDVSLYAEDIESYRLPPAEFEAFCSRSAEEWERQQNMDW